MSFAKKKLIKGLGAVIMCAALLMMTPFGALASTISDIEARQEELEQKKEELTAQLESLKEDEAQKEEYLAALQEKIDVLQEQIDSARADIETLNEEINELTLKLDEAQAEVQDTIDQFKERLKVLYKEGDVSTLEILLSSDSFSDFTMRSELIKTMTEHDRKLLEVIEQYMNETQDEREECEASKEKVAELKKSLESDQDELNDLYDEYEIALAAVRESVANTEKLYEDNEAELAENEEAMQAAIAEQQRLEEEAKKAAEEAAAAAAAAASSSSTTTISGTTYPTGGGGVEGFNPIWPLPGVTYVSCYYGGYSGHRGMDIAGAYGTAVVAAESGTVIAANDYDSWGDSWGYYVLIYHNSTFTTRYAHLSSLTVSQGQYVEQGTVIGYEGATGNVTGPHLHFEVYQNGTRVDPMNFL